MSRRSLGWLLVLGCVAVLAAPGALALDGGSKEACKQALGGPGGGSGGTGGVLDACGVLGEVCDDAGIAIDEPGVHRACTVVVDLDADGALDLAAAACHHTPAPTGDCDDAAAKVRAGHEMAKSIIQNIRA